MTQSRQTFPHFSFSVTSIFRKKIHLLETRGCVYVFHPSLHANTSLLIVLVSALPEDCCDPADLRLFLLLCLFVEPKRQQASFVILLFPPTVLQHELSYHATKRGSSGSRAPAHDQNKNLPAVSLNTYSIITFVQCQAITLAMSSCRAGGE